MLLISVGCFITGCDGEKSAVATQSNAVQTPTPSAVQNKAEHSEFKAVELDRFIEQEKEAALKLDGKKLIKRADPVRFVASVKQLPKQKKLTYIYTALEVAKISPLPNVEHQMFIESKDGQIISVYVETQAATRLSQELTDGQEAEFFGYHVYTYKRGPAILLADFAPISK